MPYGGHAEQAAPNVRGRSGHVSNLKRGKISTVRGKRKGRRARRH